jgi:hypothetical protein
MWKRSLARAMSQIRAMPVAREDWRSGLGEETVVEALAMEKKNSGRSRECHERGVRQISDLQLQGHGESAGCGLSPANEGNVPS